MLAFEALLAPFFRAILLEKEREKACLKAVGVLSEPISYGIPEIVFSGVLRDEADIHLVAVKATSDIRGARRAWHQPRRASHGNDAKGRPKDKVQPRRKIS